MSKKAYDKAVDKILEEVFADAYAGINDYGARAVQFNEEARQTERDFRSSENAAATAQRTGPPKQKSPAGLKKDLRDKLLSAFHTPDGYKQYLGNLVNEYADRILEKGSLTDEETAALFDALYEEGSVKTAADEVFQEARKKVRGAKIYVPESIKHEFGDDWRDFQRRAFGQGVLLTNNPADMGIDEYHAEISDAFPGVFDPDETDMRTILESIVNAADYGKGKTMSLGDYGTSMEAALQDGWAYDSREEQQAELRRAMEEALQEFVDQAGRENYSLSEQTKSREYDEAIDLLDRNELPRDADTHIQVLEHTPRIYIDKAGAKDRRVVISWESAYLAMKKNGEQPGNYHNLGPELMKQIPQKLASPEYVVIRPDGRINAILEMRKKNRPILVSVEMEAFLTTTQGSQQDDDTYNLIVTVMDASQNYLKNNVFSKGRIVENKNKEDPAHFISRLKLSRDATMPTNDLAGASENYDSITSNKVKLESSENTDAEYMAAAEAGDMETAQRMVDEAAKKAGYTIKAYHGTPNKFNVFLKSKIGSTTDYGWFGRGFYFTTEEDIAKVYSGYLNDSNVIEAYLKVQNPFVFSEYPGGENMSAGEIMDDVLGIKRRGELTEEDKAQRSENFTDWLRESGYDGAKIWSQIMILDSEQAKRTDAVTYDNDGNVIPLSERFNPADMDIRYSREIDPEVAALYKPESIEARRGRRGGGKRKVSRVRSNTYDASGLFNEVEAQMNEADEQNYTYDPISEKRSLNEAIGRLRSDFDGEVSKLSQENYDWGGSDLDTAMGILHQYRTEGRQTGDYSAFWNWSKTIQEKGTKDGQFVQAFAKYTRTGTGQAQKAAEDLRKQFSLNPAQEQQVKKTGKRVRKAVEDSTQDAADDALKQAKGRKQSSRKADTWESQRRKDAEQKSADIPGEAFLKHA